MTVLHELITRYNRHLAQPWWSAEPPIAYTFKTALGRRGLGMLDLGEWNLFILATGWVTPPPYEVHQQHLGIMSMIKSIALIYADDEFRVSSYAKAMPMDDFITWARSQSIFNPQHRRILNLNHDQALPRLRGYPGSL